MKVWRSFGSEHSMDLVIVGTFQTATDAESALELMAALQDLATKELPDDDWQRSDERLPDGLLDALMELKLYDMGRFDVDNFRFEYSAVKEASSVTVTTEESEIQGFLKVLLRLGAKVELFSRHDWNEDGTPRAEKD